MADTTWVGRTRAKTIDENGMQREQEGRKDIDNGLEGLFLFTIIITYCLANVNRTRVCVGNASQSIQYDRTKPKKKKNVDRRMRNIRTQLYLSAQKKK